MAIFDFSNTRSRVTFLCGVLIAFAKHHDLWTNQECLYAIAALLLGLIVFSATGAIFFYWAIGNFKGVVAVMKRNADDPRAQWLGCGAIGFGGNRNEQKIKAVAEAGGADVVVAAMRAHAIYHGVQQEGCGALMALASDKEASSKVVSAGGVVSLLAALQYALGKANEGVLMKGMGALATLATTPANKEVLVKAGAADKVLGTRFYLLYWYKSANTDAEGAASVHQEVFGERARARRLLQACHQSVSSARAQPGAARCCWRC